MRTVEATFGDDEDQQLTSDADSEVKLGPDFDSSSSSNVVVNQNDAEYILLNSFFNKKLFINELRVYASSAGTVQFSLFHARECNSSSSCVDYLTNNANSNTVLKRQYVFKVSSVFCLNLI